MASSQGYSANHGQIQASRQSVVPNLRKPRPLETHVSTDKFEIEDNRLNEIKILKIANEKYRNWRSTLAATYRSYETDEERLEHVPEELTIGVWKALMSYFESEKFQNISQINSTNRSKQKYQHTCGSKPFAQVSYEMRDEETGDEPSDVHLWEKTHTNKMVTGQTMLQRKYMILHLQRLSRRKMK